MREPDGDVVASAPLAAVELSTSALWSGRIVPARVELIEPRLLLSYSDDTGLSLSFPKPVEGEAEDERRRGQEGAAASARRAARRRPRPRRASAPRRTGRSSASTSPAW